MPTQPAKSSSVYGWTSESSLSLLNCRIIRLAGLFVLIAWLLPGHFAQAAAMQNRTPITTLVRSTADNKCPSPREREFALEQASTLLRQAQYLNAAKILQPLANLKCDPRINLLLAAALEGGGEIKAADEALEQAHSTWPSNNSISASLAREYMSRGQVDNAATALARFHATATTPPQEMEEAILVLLASHQLFAAEGVARVAYNAQPSLHPLLLLANTLQLEGRYKAVIIFLDSKRTNYAQSPEFLVTIAESEYDASIFDKASQDLERAIELDPTMYQAHYLLGNVLMKQGEIDRAVTEYRAAIGLAPNQPRTYDQLALALRANQDIAGEQDVLTKALALDGHDALAHSEMGRILLSQNRFAEAVVQLNLAITDNPHLEQPYNLLARAYDRLGDIGKARAAAKRLTEIRAANHKGATDRDKLQLQADHTVRR
jgi:Flp pilus assembly protein TadD